MPADIKKSVFAFFISDVLILTCAFAAERIENPYADVAWDKAEYLHSFSHQHGHDPQIFWDMGYRHLPFSNYYPSKPLYPLPEAFVRKHPDVIGCPNAEQHGLTDSSIHFNVLGSFYTTGYGDYNFSVKTGKAPVERVFEGLTVFDPQHAPWRGIYRLDLNFAPAGGTNTQVEAALTIEGAIRVNQKTLAVLNGGIVRDLPLTAKSSKWFFLKAQSDSMRVKIDFDPAITKIKRFRLMQGTNRPWRDAFQAALDGTLKDAQGNPVEGLLYPDGGGITINHPRCGLKTMLTLLDFDKRVLGLEVWNCLSFGATASHPKKMEFYDLWDDVLRRGRRCFGFFVKDHFQYARGRNVLLVSGLSDLTVREREREALRTYRQGRFFGLLGAMSVDESGKVVTPYDNSDFKFTRIAVRKDSSGKPAGLDVAVGGADKSKRPNTQIRFVTDQGVAQIDNKDTAFFAFPHGPDGRILCKYVRAEAFAYPNTHLGGKLLTQDTFSVMNVFQIAQLHDRLGGLRSTAIYAKGQEPIGIVDMLFAQPVLVRH